MNSKITTLLFDLDGTLINTNELIIASFTETLNHFCPGQIQAGRYYSIYRPDFGRYVFFY